MDTITAMIMMAIASGGASDGLVRLAVFGSGGNFATEVREAYGDAGVARTGLSGNNTANRVGNDFTDVILPLLGTCSSVAAGEQEYMASNGVELSDGSKWAMVHPSCHPDHFIIEYNDGTAERWDVGCDENTRIPRLLSSTTNPSMTSFPAEMPWSAATSIAPACSAGFSANPPVLLPTTEQKPSDDSQMMVENSDDSGTNSGNPGNSGGGSGGGAALAVGGIAAVGIAVYLFSGGTAADVSFVPEYDFSYDNTGGARYSYGSRWMYEKENFRAEWAAARIGEEMRYESSLQWRSGMWAAAVGGESFSETTDMDFLLAARRDALGWTLHSGANARAHLSEFDATFSHRLSFSAERDFSDWNVFVSANARAFGDSPSAAADIVLTREF